MDFQAPYAATSHMFKFGRNESVFEASWAYVQGSCSHTHFADFERRKYKMSADKNLRLCTIVQDRKDWKIVYCKYAHCESNTVQCLVVRLRNDPARAQRSVSFSSSQLRPGMLYKVLIRTLMVCKQPPFRNTTFGIVLDTHKRMFLMLTY